MYIQDVPNEFLFLKDDNYPITKLLGLGQKAFKGMFCQNHSNKQTTAISVSNLQCSILIVPKQYRAGCVSLFLMGQQPFSTFADMVSQCLSYHKTWIPFSKEVSTFSATSNRLEIMSLSTLLTAWLKAIGGCGETVNAQVTLCFHFGDMCPQMALLMCSLWGFKGVKDEHRLSV